MGKKVKKDDKSPPEDVFDPLLVESRQAATVVLMLESPEDEVLSKGCEAIYKFVEKCDENRRTLLDLGAVDSLLRLIQHEDRVVHRNACMALGSMAGHIDVRRALRKREESIPCLIGLLSPEEDGVVHEFALLALSCMANDYSCKVTIFEEGGLESLIRLLASHDPDVQKNAIETITLMLMDYQTKGALRELEGFPAILELLKSEYPVIQHLALVALQRATEEAENRSVLRELEGINKLINFIGKPEYSELQVFAVMVLSNCLEDPESVEQIKENGGLHRLVAFITDTQPAEEEEKKGKKDRGASKAGKKGKGEDGRSSRGTPLPTANARASRTGTRAGTSQRPTTQHRTTGVFTAIAESPIDSRAGTRNQSRGASRLVMETDDKNRSRSEADPIIPTPPEVKEHAARAIARAAKNADNRKVLHEQETEKMLILLLAHEDPGVQVAAAQALGVMAENLLSREAIGQWEGLEPIIKLTKNDNADVREAASMALGNLTTSNMTNCSEVVRLHGVEPLITMLSDPRELASANAAVILTNMAPDEGLRSEVLRLGVINALVEPLRSKNTIVQSKMALAVSAYIGDYEHRTAFRESSGIEPLVALLHSRNDDVRRSASWAVTVCAVDEESAMEISRHSGLEILQEIQLSESRKNAFTDIALDRLLDSNLSAKYALSGVLTSSNKTRDGFFDAGQLKAGTKFLSLEDYYKQDLNQKRPMLLVNVQPEKPSTPLPQSSEIEVSEKLSRSSITGRTSRTGRESKMKVSRAQREREERQKEEELAQQQQQQQQNQADEQGDQQPFVPPGDNNLIQYVEEVKDRIGPLPTTKDQVVALAVYVSDKLGGPVDRGQVANFSWQLPLSQLKFDLKSNVVPLGKIKAGIHYHRALLFKVLADRCAVDCSLIRGEYNRAWNEVLLTDDADAPGAPRFPPKAYIVDLMHQPGRLMRSDSPDALNYQKL